MFVVTKMNQSGVSVQDTSEYLNSSIFTVLGKIRYTFDESYTIHVIEKLDSEEQTKYMDYSILQHTKDDSDLVNVTKSQFCNLEDGLYAITLIIIPNKDWVDKNKAYLNDYYRDVFYTDGNKLYDLNNKVVSLEDMVLCGSNIVSCSQYIFLLDLLELKFKLISIQNISNKKSDITNYVIWVGIDAIKYCLSLENYFAAESRLNLILNCLGQQTTKPVREWPIKPGSGCSCLNLKRNGTKRLY